jgi:uncharacterized membrane protein
MFIFLDLQTALCSHFVGVVMIYRHVKFHIRSLNGSLIVTVRPSTNESLRAASLFYIRKADVIKKIAYFSVIHFHTLYSVLMLKDVSVLPTYPINFGCVIADYEVVS